VKKDKTAKPNQTSQASPPIAQTSGKEPSGAEVWKQIAERKARPIPANLGDLDKILTNST
jgi:hypothetical protein